MRNSRRIHLLRKCTLALAVLLCVLILPIYTIKIYQKTDYSDFLVYYRSAQRFFSAQWAQIYDLESNGNCPFRYAPVLLPFFGPLTWLPYEASRVAWFYFNYLCYAWGFWILYRWLKRLNGDAVWILATSALFTLRFFLDSFTIGQITGVIFLALAFTLQQWTQGNQSRAGSFLLAPTLLKIGPGFLYLLLNPRSWLGAALTLAVLFPILWLVGGSDSSPGVLFQYWWEMLRGDSSFFDASHYGSQSLNSALLRAAKLGLWSDAQARSLALAGTVIGCLSILALWKLRPAKTQLTQGIYFSLGVLSFLWFMPFSFKYSFPVLAIPVAVMLSGPMGWFQWLSFAFGAFTLSLAGLDLVGETVFFFLQKASFPFFATLLVGAALVHQVFLQRDKESKKDPLSS